MDIEEIQLDLHRQFRGMQERYVYYIIALSVSSLAFAIYQTKDSSLARDHIVLGLAVLGWGVSIYCGLKFVRYGISIIYSNAGYYDIAKGKNEIAGNDPAKQKIAMQTLKDIIQENVQVANRYYKGMSWGFYSGVLFFVCWHILEMYLRSQCS